MRVGVATVHTPGIHGGAEFLADGLMEALRAAGHAIHKISVPFVFEPPAAAGVTLERCQAVDFTPHDGGQIDVMIGLKFPAYAIGHPDKRLWLLHQHRAAYDLYGTVHGWQPGNATTDALRARIIAADAAAFAGSRAVFTISERVSERLAENNGVASRPLYHPPANAEAFWSAPAEPYIFAPSRLEALKRQDLLLRALARCRTPVQAVFAGQGSLHGALLELAERLGIADRVRFVGAVGRDEMLSLYAHAAAVFFGPLDEDYGYVTLEAMLAEKPVITCTDSGGPLEFVIDGETGLICAPEAEAIAAALERLAAAPERARQWGRNGRQRYGMMKITWDDVVAALLAPVPAGRGAGAGALVEA